MSLFSGICLSLREEISIRYQLHQKPQYNHKCARLVSVQKSLTYFATNGFLVVNLLLMMLSPEVAPG